MRVYVSEQKRGVTRAIKRELKRRAAVEPVIRHLKSDHRMDRNYLIGSHGDAANAVLAAVGYNFADCLAEAAFVRLAVPVHYRPLTSHASLVLLRRLIATTSRTTPSDDWRARD
jgi:hypothetical protein